MKLTRRQFAASAAAVPLAAALSRPAWAQEAGVMLYDPDLPQAGALAGDPSATPITGDRIRFAREVFAARPARVRGISRQGDAVLIEDVAREAGYILAEQEVDGGALSWLIVPRS